MASTPVMSFRPATVQTCSGNARKSNKSTSGNWWSPIFGWAPEPDYIETGPEKEADPARKSPKFAAFTEEKARQLRIRTLESSTFHDAMYHSAIASRLASDFTTRSE